jgi:uncharacterized GH25 family protein
MKKLILILLPIILISFVSAINLNTSLKITVLDELGNIVVNAKVDLYASGNDYDNNTNAVQESLYSDKKGRVTFKNLDKKKYWINVEKGDKNNFGAGVEVILEPGKINKSTIIIE